VSLPTCSPSTPRPHCSAIKGARALLRPAPSLIHPCSGSDGATYANACKAGCANASVAREGACVDLAACSCMNIKDPVWWVVILLAARPPHPTRSFWLCGPMACVVRRILCSTRTSRGRMSVRGYYTAGKWRLPTEERCKINEKNKGCDAQGPVLAVPTLFPTLLLISLPWFPPSPPSPSTTGNPPSNSLRLCAQPHRQPTFTLPLATYLQTPTGCALNPKLLCLSPCPKPRAVQWY